MAKGHVFGSFKVLIGVTLFIGAAAIVWAHFYAAGSSLPRNSFGCLLAGASALLLLIPRYNGELGVARAFVMLLVLFHCGLTWTLIVGVEPTFFNSTDSIWYGSPTMGDALAYVSVFILVLILSSSVFSLLLRYSSNSGGVGGRAIESSYNGASGVSLAIDRFVLSLLAISILLWFSFLFASGASVFGTDYQEFRLLTESGPQPYLYLVIGVSMGMLGMCRKRSVYLGLSFFLVFALVAFPIGLRGMVLIPGAAFLLTFSRFQWRRVSLPLVIVLLIVGLSAGSFVRVLRQGDSAGADASPLEGLYEMGYTIRTVVAVLESGEFTYGWFTGIATYVNPVIRLFGVGEFFGVSGASDDVSAFNTYVAQEFGNIGGSPVAEALRAGGPGYLIGVAVILGLLLSVLDWLPISPASMTVYGGTSFVLLLWVRNSFVPVPAQLLLVALLSFTCLWVQKASRGRVATLTPSAV